MNKQSYKGMLLIFICSLLWSTAGMFIKLVPWNPLVMTGWRGLIAAVPLYIYLKHKKQPLHLTWRSVRLAIFVCATSFLYLFAVKLTTAANAIVLQYTAPVFLIIFSMLLLKKRYHATDYITVIITLCGIALFFLDQLTTGGTYGNIIAIADGACLALVYLFSGENTESERLTGIFFGMLFSAIIGIPFTALYPPQLTLESIGAVLFMGIFQLGLPYVLFSIALNTCPPLACSLISSLEIILNPVWVYLSMGEMPGKFALIGSAVIVTVITLWYCYGAYRDKKNASTI